MEKANLVLLIVLVALGVFTIKEIFGNNDKFKSLEEELDIAKTSIIEAQTSLYKSKESVDQLKENFALAQDSLNIVIAERDSIIIWYKQWGSDEQFREQNKVLKEKTGELNILREKFRKLKEKKNKGR